MSFRLRWQDPQYTFETSSPNESHGEMVQFLRQAPHINVLLRWFILKTPIRQILYNEPHVQWLDHFLRQAPYNKSDVEMLQSSRQFL